MYKLNILSSSNVMQVEVLLECRQAGLGFEISRIIAFDRGENLSHNSCSVVDKLRHFSLDIKGWNVCGCLPDCWNVCDCLTDRLM